LGLPHDAGSQAEQSWGTSLMGSGNHTYRQELWGGGGPTLLSRASTLWLAAHPLFTGSNRGRWRKTGGGFEDVKFSNVRGALHLAGKVRGDIAPYALVAYVYPVRNKTDHHAKTYPVPVKEGVFDIQLGALWPQEYHLVLVALHVNGGTSTQRLRFGFDKKLQPDVDALTWRFRMQTEFLPW
jgi:hypothetical protein